VSVTSLVVAALVDERRRIAGEREAARAEAEAASRAKDAFLATLSHELRTPLNAILGWAEILRGRVDGETVANAVERITRNVRLQIQLVEDLLDLSRIAAGKVRMRTRPVDLAPIVLAAAETVRPSAEAKTIQVATHIETGPTVVNGDADRLQQVVWNLLSNAVKFTPRHGRITVRLDRIDSRAVIRVSDTGKGIKPEILPSIFERFRQGNSSLAREHGGLGLGLAIVRQLVELQGGEVIAESAGEGRGATFTVTFALLASGIDRSTALPNGRAGEGPRCDGIDVLVVDDEEDTRMLLRAFLQGCGAVVTVTDTVREALALLDRHRFDVIVCDLAMPGEDGLALARQLRARPGEQGERLPLIALTAHAGADMRRQALTAGFDTCLAKPVPPAELAAVVARLARRRPSA
jgi:CheY-like chemotaxis protein/nitrogen-specific signal transduction histidine kinase